jgi:hypothetical protein
MVRKTRIPLLQADPGPVIGKNRDWLSIGVYSGSEARWGVPLVSMVNSTNTGQSDNLVHCFTALGPAGFFGMDRETVRSLTGKPSLSNSA